MALAKRTGSNFVVMQKYFAEFFAQEFLCACRSAKGQRDGVRVGFNRKREFQKRTAPPLIENKLSQARKDFRAAGKRKDELISVFGFMNILHGLKKLGCYLNMVFALGRHEHIHIAGDGNILYAGNHIDNFLYEIISKPAYLSRGRKFTRTDILRLVSATL